MNFCFSLLPLGFVTLPAVAALPAEPSLAVSPAAGFEDLIGPETLKTQAEAGDPMTRNRRAVNSGSLAGLPPSGSYSSASGNLGGGGRGSESSDQGNIRAGVGVAGHAPQTKSKCGSRPVAQSGSAPGWRPGVRRFKSGRVETPVLDCYRNPARQHQF